MIFDVHDFKVKLSVMVLYVMGRAKPYYMTLSCDFGWGIVRKKALTVKAEKF